MPRRGASTPGGPTNKGLPRIWLRVGHPLMRRLEATASASRTRLSEVVKDLLMEALDARQEGRQWTHFKADEALERLDRLESRLDRMGPDGRGILRLLAHWAARTGELRVDEDQLLAEVRGVGEDEWQQVLEELREGPRSGSDADEQAAAGTE